MGKIKCGAVLLVVLGIILVNERVSARKWNTDKDSVIVDAQYADDEEGELHFDALMDQAERPECVTLDHEPGMCVTLRKCHPILFGENGELRNPSLAEVYSQNVDTCGQPNNGIEDEPSINEHGDDMEDIDDEMIRSAVPSTNKAVIGDKLLCCAKDKIPYAQRSLDDEEEHGYTYPPTTAVPIAVALGGDVEAVTNAEELLVIDSGVAPVAEAFEEIAETTARPESVQSLSESAPAEDITEAPVSVEPEVQPSSSSVPEASPDPSVPSSPVPVEESSPVSIPEEGSVPQSANEVVEVPEDENVQPIEQADACPAVSLYNTWPSFENYPFLAAIQVRANTGPLCSGSLIDDRHILTAAHCLHRFNSKDVARMQVRLGFTKNPLNDTFNDFYTERKASKIIFHKRFHEQSKMDNNIALVQLDQPVEFDEHVAPIRIFNGARGFDTGECAGVEAGWIKYGNRKVTGISDGVIQYIEPPMSDFVLREAINKIYKNADCQKSLYTEITEDMLCAKTENFEARGVTATHFRGNDGGPLIIRVGDHVQQVGIKSWAYEGHQYPTVFIRSDRYLTWIKDNLEM